MKTEEELSCEKASEIFQMVSFWDDRDEREIMIIISFCFSLTNTTVEFSFSQISVALGVCVCVYHQRSSGVRCCFNEGKCFVYFLSVIDERKRDSLRKRR